MKTIFTILFSLIVLNQELFGQCDCIPSIPAECIRPCFIKKISNFNDNELKTLLNEFTAVPLNDSIKKHNLELAKMILEHVKKNKDLNFDMDQKDKTKVDEVLGSKKFATKLEGK